MSHLRVGVEAIPSLVQGLPPLPRVADVRAAQYCGTCTYTVEIMHSTSHTNVGRTSYVPHLLIGTTEESNWLIPGKLLVGAYPASVVDEVNARILTGILATGVTTFVCLQQECVTLLASLAFVVYGGDSS